MASEPAEPTTRQDQLIEKATRVLAAHHATLPIDVPHLPLPVQVRAARALADAHLLADPAQTTELAGVVDVPVGSKAYRLINELTADLEQSRAQRNEAMETAGQLRDEVREHQVAAANLYGRVFVAMGLSVTAPWAGLADAAGRVRAERDALSLLLRGMARKLVTYRKRTLGDDVPAVHRLRRELAEATEINQDWQRYKRRKIAERRQMEAELAEAREGGKKVLALAEKFQAERDERQARIDVLERWLRPEVVVGWIQPRGYRHRYLAEDVIRGLLAGDPIASDQTCAALLGDQPPTPADKTWCPRCQKDATEDRYTQESASLWRCLDCHAVLQVPDPPLSGVALRAVEEADDAAGDLP